MVSAQVRAYAARCLARDAAGARAAWRGLLEDPKYAPAARAWRDAQTSATEFGDLDEARRRRRA